MKVIKPYSGNGKNVNVIIETVRGSNLKYKYNKDLDLFTLNKFLPAGTFFPFNFGFIPGTQGDDGDPVDVLIIDDHTFFVGCHIECRLIGVIEATQKEAGKTKERNDRLLAIPVKVDPHEDLKTFKNLDKKQLEEIIRFFEYYNKMHGIKFTSKGLKGPSKAHQYVNGHLV
jgi:inorganic pyrophosphatase